MLNIIKCKRTKNVLFFGRGCTSFIILGMIRKVIQSNLIVIFLSKETSVKTSALICDDCEFEARKTE